jgi:hypothetical protein
MTYTYEWTWELCDTEGEIIDQGFWDSLRECREDAPAGADLALMWRDGNDDDGELERAYAYCQPGPTGSGLVLPDFFDNGWHRVPKRFHAEVRRFHAVGGAA